MMWLAWQDAKQYKIYSVSASKYMLAMTEVVMCLRHESLPFGSTPSYDPITVKVRVDNDGDHTLRGYSTNFPAHKVSPIIFDSIMANCKEIAVDIVKTLKR
jgi:hypothetical protein